jgi:hypothetical protein
VCPAAARGNLIARRLPVLWQGQGQRAFSGAWETGKLSPQRPGVRGMGRTGDHGVHPGLARSMEAQRNGSTAVPKIPSRPRTPVTSLPLSMPISDRIPLRSPAKQVFIDQSGEGVTSLPFYGYSIVFFRLFNGRKKRVRYISPAKALHPFRPTVASLPLKRCISPKKCHLRLVYQ